MGYFCFDIKTFVFGFNQDTTTGGCDGDLTFATSWSAASNSITLTSEKTWKRGCGLFGWFCPNRIDYGYLATSDNCRFLGISGACISSDYCPIPDGIGTGRLLFLRPDTNGFASYTYIVGECLSNNNPDGTSTECISIYGSSGSSKKVCNTAINMCKTIDCHYENLAVLPGYSYAETCVSPAGNLADACSGSTERMALCDSGTNSCYYYDTSCSGDTPACAVDGDGRAVCVECAIDTDCKGTDGTYNTYCPKDSTTPNYILPSCTVANTCQCATSCVGNAECAPNFCCTAESPQGPNIKLPGKTEYTCEPKGTTSNPWLCT